MANRRVERLNEQVKRELTDLLRNEVRDPRIGWVTVTDVRVTPDLYHARVYLTSIASEEERGRLLEGLEAASSYLRGELGRRLRVRRTPELHFEWDRTLEQAQRIERLLHEMRPSRPADEGAPEEDDGQ